MNDRVQDIMTRSDSIDEVLQLGAANIMTENHSSLIGERENVPIGIITEGFCQENL